MVRKNWSPNKFSRLLMAIFSTTVSLTINSSPSAPCWFSKVLGIFQPQCLRTYYSLAWTTFVNICGLIPHHLQVSMQHHLLMKSYLTPSPHLTVCFHPYHPQYSLPQLNFSPHLYHHLRISLLYLIIACLLPFWNINSMRARHLLVLVTEVYLWPRMLPANSRCWVGICWTIGCAFFGINYMWCALHIFTYAGLTPAGPMGMVCETASCISQPGSVRSVCEL